MGNIYVIGPTGAGKTTYLAGLAYWPDRTNSKFRITGITEDAKKIAAKAETIILNGASLEPTIIDGVKIKSFYDLPLYSFQIDIKRQWWQMPEEINLAMRDYPGEIFNELTTGVSNPLHQEFLEECLIKDVVGCLILFHKWEAGSDLFYAQVIERFINLMDERDRTQDLRLAVAMSKCERGEIWPGRLEPELDIFQLHLPRTTSILRRRIPYKNLQFYAISTFGVLHRNDPRPNRTDELGSPHSVLREPLKWRPYGMISPLYWLSKGKKMGLTINN